MANLQRRREYGGEGDNQSKISFLFVGPISSYLDYKFVLLISVNFAMNVISTKSAVFKNDEFEEIINRGMGSIDKKIQEAIEDIKAHGSRIKNLFKKIR